MNVYGGRVWLVLEYRDRNGNPQTEQITFRARGELDVQITPQPRPFASLADALVDPVIASLDLNFRLEAEDLADIHIRRAPALTLVGMLEQLHELAGRHSSAHPAYHKHCHEHPDDRCADCKWLAELEALLETQTERTTK